MQRAVLYRNEYSFLVYPAHRTSAGFHIHSAPFLSAQEEADTLGAAVRTALANSMVDVPVPPRDCFKQLAESRLKAAGVRSESAFQKKARLVDIFAEIEFVIVPNANGGETGSERGFTPIHEKELRLPITSDNRTLGEICLRALSACH